MGVDVLPDELLHEILSYLPYGDIVRVSGVSKRFHHWAHDPVLWGRVKVQLPVDATAADLSALLSWAPDLHHVSLSGCKYIEDDGLVEFVAVAGALKTLNLADCAVTETAVRSVSGLAEVDLSRVRGATDDSVADLAACCPGLRTLTLCANINLTDRGVIAFAAQCPALDSVTLRGCRTLSPLAAIAAVALCPRLTRLGLAASPSMDGSVCTVLGARWSKESSCVSSVRMETLQSAIDLALSHLDQLVMAVAELRVARDEPLGNDFADALATGDLDTYWGSTAYKHSSRDTLAPTADGTTTGLTPASEHTSDFETATIPLRGHMGLHPAAGGKLESLNLVRDALIKDNDIVWLSDMPALTELRCAQTYLSDASFAAAVVAPRIQSLDFLWCPRIADSRFVPSLAACSSLTKLNITKTSLTEDGLTSLVLLKDSLRSLVMSKLEGLTDSVCITVFAEVTKLARLRMSASPHLTDVGVAAALRGNRDLVEFAAKCNKVDGSAFCQLEPGDLPRLYHLTLGAVTSQACRAIGRVASRLRQSRTPRATRSAFPDTPREDEHTSAHIEYASTESSASGVGVRESKKDGAIQRSVTEDVQQSPRHIYAYEPPLKQPPTVVHLSSLQSLSITVTGVEPSALKELAASRPRFTSLQLQAYDSDDGQLAKLLACSCESLKAVVLTGEGVNDSIANVLARMSSLTSLRVRQASITDEFLFALSSSFFPALATIEFSHCESISEAGLVALGPSAPRCTYMYLPGVNVDVGVLQDVFPLIGGHRATWMQPVAAAGGARRVIGL